jgi:UDP-N-acetylenolpyruvoylglucosamine reductase
MLQIQENISLKNFNTFGIDVGARYFAEITDAGHFYGSAMAANASACAGRRQQYALAQRF